MRIPLTAVLLLSTTLSYALHIECVGRAEMVDNGGDTLLIFASSPQVRTLYSVGPTDWYRLPDTISPIQSGTDYLYPEHGYGYRIKVDGQWEEFWVFDYDSLCWQVDEVSVETDCQRTRLNLVGMVPEIRYTHLDGSTAQYDRPCRVNYTDGVWDTEELYWTDSSFTVETTMAKMISLDASALRTRYTLSDPMAEQLGVACDSLITDDIDPVALKANPVSITTTRGSHSQPSNEVNRPYTKDDIINISAPLDVLFVGNGLNAEYYLWHIYKGSQLLVSRTDADHRYIFTEPGNYRVTVAVSNLNCDLDTVEFILSVSTSMLLVPNVFTPNGDGANDEFRVAYRSLREFHCWVYNRWGLLVYEWDDPAKGWNGTIGGKPAAEGAYYYVIRALGTDAAYDTQYMWKPSHKKAQKKDPESRLGVYQLSGSINLLRGGK